MTEVQITTEDLDPETVGDVEHVTVPRALEDSDPIADVEANKPKNRARVGSVRPSAMLYTQGIGSTVDLPHLSVMPHGLDDWDRIYAAQARWRRRPSSSRGCCDVVRAHLGKPCRSSASRRGRPRRSGRQQSRDGPGHPRTGLPAVAAVHRLRRCSARSPRATASSTGTPTRIGPTRREFIHRGCTGWAGAGGKACDAQGVGTAPAVPARYLIACAKGHLDEFPYVAWVHRGEPCLQAASTAPLRMREWKSNIGPDVQIMCMACNATRGMLEATAPEADTKLPTLPRPSPAPRRLLQVR